MPLIEARPFPFQFDFDHVALIRIDMQRDFLRAGRLRRILGNKIENIQPCIPVIAKLQAEFRRCGIAGWTCGSDAWLEMLAKEKS